MLGLTKFKEDFGVYDEDLGEYKLPTSWESAGTGPPIAGLAIGALLSGFVGSRIGRIRSFQLATIIAIVGITIQCTAISSYWQITVGRVITSTALGIMANTVPAYQAECAPSKIRGTLVNCCEYLSLLTIDFSSDTGAKH